MSNKRCENCYYVDKCPNAEVCDDFTPITDEAENAIVDEGIEHRREEFRADWNTYISANQD